MRVGGRFAEEYATPNYSFNYRFDAPNFGSAADGVQALRRVATDRYSGQPDSTVGGGKAAFPSYICKSANVRDNQYHLMLRLAQVCASRCG